MIPGTGPGRGVPWWRSGRIALLWRVHTQPEPIGLPREGRLIRRVPR